MPGVAVDAGEAARAPGVQPRQAEEVQPRHLRDAALVHGMTTLVEYPRVEPAEIRREADAPDHAADARFGHRERRAFGWRLPHRAVHATRRRSDGALGDVPVDAGVDA